MIWDLRVFFSPTMAIPPGLYSGTSSLALVYHLSLSLSPIRLLWVWLINLSLFDQVARASAFSVGLLYGSMKLKVLKVTLSNLWLVVLVSANWICNTVHFWWLWRFELVWWATWYFESYRLWYHSSVWKEQSFVK